MVLSDTKCKVHLFKHEIYSANYKLHYKLQDQPATHKDIPGPASKDIPIHS